MAFKLQTELEAKETIINQLKEEIETATLETAVCGLASSPPPLCFGFMTFHYIPPPWITSPLDRPGAASRKSYRKSS
jgi:hypothetical protein